MNTNQRQYIGPKLRLFGKSFTALAFVWVLLGVCGVHPMEPATVRASVNALLGFALMVIGEFITLGGDS